MPHSNSDLDKTERATQRLMYPSETKMCRKSPNRLPAMLSSIPSLRIASSVRLFVRKWQNEGTVIPLS